MIYTWLLFDADDTLFDYAVAEEKALRATFTQLNFVFQPELAQLYRQINSQIWKEFEAGQISSQRLRVERFERLMVRTGLQADAEFFSQTYLTHLASSSDLFPGTEEILRKLASHFQLALITNGIKSVQRQRLQLSSIQDLFEAVIISDEIGAAKPMPQFFDILFEQIGQPERAEALVIGDSLTSDIQGANLYGLDACWFNPRRLPADSRYPARYEIRQLRELYAILDLPEAQPPIQS
jgi:2-haloacid dehalogenase